MTDRRNFIRRLAVSTAGVALAPTAKSYARILGANERVRMGIIGMGRISRGHLGNLTQESDVDVAMLCDVYEPNLRHALISVPGAATTSDFREVLDRSDIDAVLVGTPDHWHALPTVMACQAGKDVYVEKPTAVFVTESRKMVDAARRDGRIVQVGTQQRSAPHFSYAAELVRSGALGKVSFVRTWNYSNDFPAGIGNPPDSDPPEGLDWNMWLGPAPSRPFNQNRFGIFLDENLEYQRWASFRWFWDYAGGMMTDWGVHLLDIVQWAMDVQYPDAVTAIGGKLGLEDNRETPDTLQVTFQYPGFVCTYENRVANGRPLDGHGYGMSFHGSEATLFADRSGFEVQPESGSGTLPSEAQSLGESHRRHMRSFIESVKTRATPVSDIEAGHRSSSVAMLGNIAYRSGRLIRWDGANERIIGDDDAAAMLSHHYRGPWKL